MDKMHSNNVWLLSLPSHNYLHSQQIYRKKKKNYLSSLPPGKFSPFFAICGFFQNYVFRKNLSGIPSEYRIVWIQTPNQLYIPPPPMPYTGIFVENLSTSSKDVYKIVVTQSQCHSQCDAIDVLWYHTKVLNWSLGQAKVKRSITLKIPDHWFSYGPVIFSVCSKRQWHYYAS